MHSAVEKVAEDLSLSRENLSLEEVEKAIRTLLLWVGENPDREGLLETPKRIAKVYKELFSGYGESVDEILGVVFEEVAGYDEPVIVKDIFFYSHCEHHMIPIIGKAHVAYLPDKKIVGLSKIARVVDVFAHRLQTQETMTAQVANSLKKYLKPRGLAVLIEAEHMCMAMRGVQKQGAATITTSFHGYYKKDQVAQANFMTITRGIR
ncbi:GTP cyclohydrolase 1 [Bartonella bacilliformis Peru38]|uniref:GTP cyclohydrolase 1 n=2 Tax=Bartonella bacilliformis TaxID=774 RepID=GCH1_BARBK|nr:GTP cyclohydrolase I FolE [Bartonella bacilliformis]A1USJ5.1 RecName: Full=GTP cyclohydrolase 1; AltName: Full=GTP cyclohydrolase I; Short=GTP-CH-I [Bartonella bacilliformis KC583]ABM44443.1 GTP cyclohydrolase I [Bartonella bacilliformis KC583]AMG85764.1 GTP cyclohydrolase I FolE [Bartonella bacilliformis]EKS44551.1 GTP cyclohydrolase I [Bartonella bacilliformis INS]EYS89833.1 GTP cyclohydrolase 1 [Bartonella bacilliformis San Pedro600-02]EYS95175.1 GTP cyclohydrolase 1 [Bartonella bacilli